MTQTLERLLVLNRGAIPHGALSRVEDHTVRGSDDASCYFFATRYEKFLHDLFGDRGDEIWMATNEQVINIAEHAHKHDPNKPIIVRTWRMGNRVNVAIGGEPTTYDISKWYRDDTPAMQKRGWGVRLTKKFADFIYLDEDLSGMTLGFDLY